MSRCGLNNQVACQNKHTKNNKHTFKEHIHETENITELTYAYNICILGP